MEQPKRLPRGARQSPRSKLAAARPHVSSGQASNNYIRLPKELSFWGNYNYGDCVTAEEAFAKACHDPEFFLTQDTAIGWATEYGYLNGANLSDVLETMQNKGFIQNDRRYNDGSIYSVDWTNAAILTDAIYQGPVKIGVAADQLETVWHKYNDPRPSPANGWFATGFTKDTNEDHCVSLCGYGSIAWLAGQLGVQAPEGVDGAQPGYALFTWSTVGIIDVPSLLNITEEAWLRIPDDAGSAVSGTDADWQQHDLLYPLCYERRVGLFPGHGQQALEGIQGRRITVANRRQHRRGNALRG